MIIAQHLSRLNAIQNWIRMFGIAMRSINENETEILIEGHLSERGWKIVDCSITCNLWCDNLDGLEADRVFLHDLEKYGASIGKGYKELPKELDRGETEHHQFFLWLHLNKFNRPPKHLGEDSGC